MVGEFDNIADEKEFERKLHILCDEYNVTLTYPDLDLDIEEDEE